jgi:hypothetical protein
VNRDFVDAAHCRHTLLGAAKINCGFYTEAAQHLDISARYQTEVIGAEYLPATDGAAIADGIAAEIAKIAGAFQIEMAVRQH